jgi:hypothetical protein
MKNILIVFACTLGALPIFAQTPRAQQNISTTEPITVTGNIIGTESGWAAGYQPARTLLVQTYGTIDRGRYVLEGPGYVVNTLGQPVTYRVQPGAPIRVVYANVDGKRMIDHVVVLSP